MGRRPQHEVAQRYEASHVDRGYKLALLGLSDHDLAVAFGVQYDTIMRWYKKHYEFREAVNVARVMADAKVAASLYQRALGYEKKVTKLATYEGRFTDREEILEHVPADVGAAQYWLKNRQKQLWTDRSEVEMTGNTGITVKFDIPRPSPEDLRIPKRVQAEVADADSTG